jgi:hypothetical protein
MIAKNNEYDLLLIKQIKKSQAKNYYHSTMIVSNNIQIIINMFKNRL